MRQLWLGTFEDRERFLDIPKKFVNRLLCLLAFLLFRGVEGQKYEHSMPSIQNTEFWI